MSTRDERFFMPALLSQYERLCRYCDDFFAALSASFPEEIHCSKGCASCCTLQTVMPIEAYVIASYLKSIATPATPPTAIPLDIETPTEGICVFLDNNICTIYPVRPMICRTHGLPLIYPGSQEVDVCCLNFSEYDLRIIERKFLFDIESATANLVRLNLAFCMITHSTGSAGERILLNRIITGQYPPKWLREEDHFRHD